MLFANAQAVVAANTAPPRSNFHLLFVIFHPFREDFYNQGAAC
jgi:hypothetical protein